MNMFNTAIFSLYQRKEIERAECFIYKIKDQLSVSRKLFILVNDDRCRRLEEICASTSPYIVVINAGRNIGVASGRNLLLNTAIEDGCDFFISCDNDIIYEKEYFSKIEAAYSELKRTEGDVGLIQPILLDGRCYMDEFGLNESSSWKDIKATLPDFSSETFYQRYFNGKKLKDYISTFYHVGISNIWSAHFGSNFVGETDLPLDTTFFTERYSLRADLEVLEHIYNSHKYIQIASTAGGVSAFDLDFLQGNGLYNTKFDPFLYEDSEFGFRAYSKGYKNYLITECIAIHDIFMGVANRKNIQYANIGRLRGVEIGSLLGHLKETSFMVKNSILSCWSGIRKQISLVKHNNNTDRANYTDKFILRYFINLFFGLFGKDSFPDSSWKENFFHSIFHKIIGQSVSNTEIQLSENIYFSIGQLTVHAKSKDVISICLMNARFEEKSSSGRENSRYFDIYIQMRGTGIDLYDVDIDIQQDELTYSVTLKLDLADVLSEKDLSNCLVDVECRTKTYYFGEFSDEVIYPEPKFSKQSFEELLGDFRDLSNYSGCKIGKALLTFLYPQEIEENSPVSVEKTNLRVESNISNVSTNRKKILVFTDSRGQHKPNNGEYQIFAERLRSHPLLDVTLVLCPMKWTTTLDFIEYANKNDISQYDHVILYTGIVDWSPRPQLSAINDLYKNENVANLDNISLNTREYSKKIVNDKSVIFDYVFGESACLKHLNSPFMVEYEGSKTVNMYSLTMANEKLIPILKQYSNLIFISANRFVSGWEGDFKRGRPQNIDLTHKYSDLFVKNLPAENILDLRTWSNEDIKRYTCDNIHLTEDGSNYIYDRLLTMVGVNTDYSIIPKEFYRGFERDLTKLVSMPDIISRGDIDISVMNSLRKTSLIIGVRFNLDEPERQDNLNLLLCWLRNYYPGFFDIILVEQDSESKLPMSGIKLKNERHLFLYNPKAYNRGWAYNVVAKHYTEGQQVLVFMDTDVLIGNNFLSDVIDCSQGNFDVISPYQNVYYTEKNEISALKKSFSFSTLNNPKRISNPVTITGGIVIFNKNVFLSLGGFEQYTGYGCEDRALDVTVLNLISHDRIKISPYCYVHLYHAKDISGRSNFSEVYSHLVDNYRCTSDLTLSPVDFIHANCLHCSAESTRSLVVEKKKYFGFKELYKSNDITVNGLVKKLSSNNESGIILPPDFSSLESYSSREFQNEYSSQTLKHFHNRYLGERCFIIGNGPSLNQHDLSLLDKEYTFGVNSIFLKSDESGFVPDFFVVEDSSVMKENIERIRGYKPKFKFFPSNYINLHNEQEDVFFFKMNRGFYEKSSPNYCVPRFSTDATKELYCGQSVTYINLQLAYFMGFSEVYLIGMDFSYVIPDSHKRTGDVLLSDSDDPNHFHKDYFGKGKTWKDPKLDRVGMNYRMAKLVYEATGRKIYNATVGGSLDVFDRVNYYELLSGKARNKNESTQSTSFKYANSLYKDKRFADALAIYIDLAEKHKGFPVYQRAAFDCYVNSKSSSQFVQDELIVRLKALL